MKNKKIIKTVVFVILAACFAAAGILDYYRGREKRIVYNHRKSHHPIVNELFAQKIRLGQPVDELVSTWPPTRYSKHDGFMTLYYVNNNEELDWCCEGYSVSIRIIAMDGRLVKALAVEGVLSETEYIFFSNLDQMQDDIYWTSRLQSLSAKK